MPSSDVQRTQIIQRTQVQPNRYVVSIDVKDQTPAQQMEMVRRWKLVLRESK